MKCDELKRHRPDIMVVGEGKAMAVMPEDPMGVWCHIQNVHDLLAEKDKEIESLKASHYAEMVDAGMRERRLKRALWLARALRARDIQRWWISVTCATITERACSVWNNVERKCRAKAEKYM